MIFLLESFFWLAVYNCHLYHMFCGNRTPSGESFPWELGMLFQSCLVKSQWTYGKKLEAKSAPTPDNSYIVFKKKPSNTWGKRHLFLGGCLEKILPRSAVLWHLSYCHTATAGEVWHRGTAEFQGGGGDDELRGWLDVLISGYVWIL